jgi:hypothetical protein
VTRVGGRVAGTVWLPIDQSPYMLAQRAAIEAVTGPESVETFSGAFACWPERLSDAFAATGLGGVETRELVAEVRLPRIAEFFPGHLSAIPWGAAVAGARADGMEAATAVALERLAPFTEPNGSVVVPFAAVLVSGTR